MDTRRVDIDKYRGEWLAWVGNKIVAHGKDFNAVVDEARKIDKDPIFDKVPEKDILVA